MKYLSQITDYVPLAPLPDVRSNTSSGNLNDLTGYLPNMFNLIIGLAAVLAVGWIIWGGIEYITTDSWTGKEAGKSRIKNAIIGLLIIMMSWLILFTINPNILNVDLNIASDTITSPAVTAGTGGATTGDIVSGPNGIVGRNNPCAGSGTNAACTSDTTNRSNLTSNQNIRVLPRCVSPSDPAQCTNLSNISSQTIDTTKVLQQNCNCSLFITGGTEHQPSNTLDLNADNSGGLNQFLTGSQTINLQSLRNPATGQITPITKQINGQTVTFTYEYRGQVSNLAGGGTVTATGNHWHVTFQR